MTDRQRTTTMVVGIFDLGSVTIDERSQYYRVGMHRIDALRPGDALTACGVDISTWRITHTSGMARAVSPDGRHIAYVIRDRDSYVETAGGGIVPRIPRQRAVLSAGDLAWVQSR